MNEVWQEQNHADTFDCWNNFTNNGLKKIYENFNEIKILLELINPQKNNKFLEIGCATGELFRYLAFFHKNIEYYGLDVSGPAIRRAKQ